MITQITNEAEYNRALIEASNLINEEPGTPEGERPQAEHRTQRQVRIGPGVGTAPEGPRGRHARTAG